MAYEVTRFAVDENGDVYKEVSLFLPTGICGVSEEDERLVEIPGWDGKWLFFSVSNSLFDEGYPAEAANNPKHPYWLGPYREAPLLPGLRLIDEATYQAALADKAVAAKKAAEEVSRVQKTQSDLVRQELSRIGVSEEAIEILVK